MGYSLMAPVATPLPSSEVERTKPWRDDIVCEFHGHHFALQQRTLITRDFKLVVSPESVNELYDRRADPYE